MGGGAGSASRPPPIIPAMTLTELRYIVAVAREKHFGRAAEACFVSQPTLSVAIKKLEEELELKLFERGTGEVSTTPLGALIEQQAPSVLDQAAASKVFAKRGQDPLSGPLRLGLIDTIGPYLLPELVRQVITLTPQMPLLLQENFTARLLDMLRGGALDCAIMAEPFPDTGLPSRRCMTSRSWWPCPAATHWPDATRPLPRCATPWLPASWTG